MAAARLERHLKVTKTLLTIWAVLLLLVGCVRDSSFPAASENSRAQLVLYVDRAFSFTEETLIIKAVEDWQHASRGTLSFKVLWNQPRPGRLKEVRERPRDGFFVWALDRGDTPNLGRLDVSTIAGFYTGNRGQHFGHIVLFQRGDQPVRFYAVIAHEIGHLLGLDHMESIQTLMHPAALRPCISEVDAAQMCRLHGCIPMARCR